LGKELLAVKEGTSLVKFFIGDFGSGKSFMQTWLRENAFKQKFVVADCDFTPERRLYGGDGQAQATYSELMKNLSTSTRPDGNALPVIIGKWLEDVFGTVQSEHGFEKPELEDETFRSMVRSTIEKELREMENLTGGFDFAKVMSAYFEAYASGNDRTMSHAMRWLRGEYTTRTEAKQDLGVRDIIDDGNWYNYLKVISQFVTRVGYSGLVLNFDEAINLYKVPSAQSRDKNYEVILQLFNDTMQGRVGHFFISFAGTTAFLEDERRGLFSYGALKRRLEMNPIQTAEKKDLAQPVMMLYPLKKEIAVAICKKVKSIYETHHETKIAFPDKKIESYVDTSYGALGGAEFTTIGTTLRGFLSHLSMIHQNPGMDISIPEKQKTEKSIAADDEMLARFSNMIDTEEKLG
jgi:hypothetical protein